MKILYVRSVSYKRSVFRGCWQRFVDGFSIYCASVKHDLAHGSTRRSRRKSVGVVRCAKTKESVRTAGIGTKRPNGQSKRARCDRRFDNRRELVRGSDTPGGVQLPIGNWGRISAELKFARRAAVRRPRSLANTASLLFVN